jgi:hypothetical protein
LIFDDRFRRHASGASANGTAKKNSKKKLLSATMVASVALSAGILLFEPARAQAVAILAAVTCSSSSPCATWQNKGSGNAIQGTAVGDSIHGISTSSGKSGVYGETDAKSGGYGVKATNSGVNGYGVYATGGPGTGVYGTTINGSGVYGTATGPDGYGVLGTASTTGDGVYAFSPSGIGIETYSTSAQALFAETSSGTKPALMAENSGTPNISDILGGDGEYISSTNGNGALIENGSSSQSGVAEATTGLNEKFGAIVGGRKDGLLVVDGDGGYGEPLQVGSWTSSGEITGYFNVDGAGDIEYSGTAVSEARTRDGAKMTAFETKATQASVEDYGTAQLAAGSAFVSLDPAFARTIDMRSPYHVFLTPEGDTRGLYVAGKTPTGFTVRETQGGRGTFAFDYRIIGSAAGGTGERMTLVTPTVEARLFPALAKQRQTMRSTL